MSFTCSACGEEHPGPPTAYSSTAPARWFELSDVEMEDSTLDGDMCAVATDAGREFFVRANIELPVTDAGEPLVFSTWIALPPAEMTQLIERWDDPGRDQDPAYLGHLANDLPGFPPTIGLQVEIHTGAPGDRSRAVIPPSEHLLANQQWEGITNREVQALAELLAHPDPSGA